jgi:hypothetical protein
MKKLTVLLCSLALVLGIVGYADALLFTNVQTIDKCLAEGPIANIFTTDKVTYQHATPGDFEVPPDTVNSATLEILAQYVNGNNDVVTVKGSAVGNLNSGGWFWNGWSSSIFDIHTTFTNWTTGSPFSVTIDANGCLLDGYLKIATSTFKLDYENGDGVVSVPEPETMLMLGFVLLGLVGVSRKRFNNRN